MRIISLSVDGIAQAAQRGLFAWLQQQSADVICLQDLRTSEDRLSDAFFPAGYCAYFCDRADGARGVAIYTKQMPRAIIQGFGYNPAVDLDGTYIRADFEQLSVVSLLVPSVAEGAMSVKERMLFLEHLQAHVKKISYKRRKYILCCNWQIAHTTADVQHWENHQTTPGFLPLEREWLDNLYNEAGYVDAHRAVNTARDVFSSWPAGAIGKGDGWRVDTQVVSPEFAPYIRRVRYCTEQAFSSHAAVMVDYDLDLY